MKRNANHQELTPVLYGKLPAKLLRLKNRPGQLSPSLHWHERFEMLVVDEGEVHLNVAGEEFTARAGDVVVVNPGYTHKGVAGEKGVAYRVLAFELVDQFARDITAADVLRPLLDGNAAFRPLVRDDPELRRLAESACDVCEQQGEGCELRLLGLIYLILGRLWEQHRENRPARPQTEQRLQDVMTYIEQHFCEEISIKELSTRFGYEESYFCRLFRSSTGLRATEYIRILRLEKARRMLKYGEDSVSNIAASCGFADANYFARCFKAHYNTTAVEYRQKNRSTMSNIIDR